MNIRVAFGKQGLSLELPDGPRYHVVQVHSAPPLPDVEKGLARSAGYSRGRLAAARTGAWEKNRGHLGLRHHASRSQSNHAASGAGAAASRRHPDRRT